MLLVDMSSGSEGGASSARPCGSVLLACGNTSLLEHTSFPGKKNDKLCDSLANREMVQELNCRVVC